METYKQREFFKTNGDLITNTDEIGKPHVKCRPDPCVFVKFRNETNLVLVAMTHVDDTLLAGKKRWIEEFNDRVKQRFNYRDEGKLEKHLEVWYDWDFDDRGERYIVATMPELVREMIDVFEQDFNMTVKEYDIYGTIGTRLNKNEGDTIDATEYMSIVQKYIYLVTRILPKGET